MKVPADPSYPKMDNNKLKFSDRLKALLKTDTRQDVDPYVFSEPEPFVTSGGKNFKLMQSKTPHSIAAKSNNKTRGKCIKRRIKLEDAPLCAETVRDSFNSPETNIEAIEATRSLELRCTSGGDGRETFCDNAASRIVVEEANERHRQARRNNRDHTLLYYPRAGDEISDSESSGDELSVYQRHWFSDVTSSSSQNRTARLSQLRSQLRRRLIQLHKGGQESELLLRHRTRCLLDEACKKPLVSVTRSFDEFVPLSGKITTGPLLVGGRCIVEGCRSTSLPCTRHCSRHIMLNADQLLFEHCTAKFSDNTQCCVPVFDVAHELPLCPEHARKRDNYHRKAQESKPKKSRKKPVSPSTVARPKNKSRPKKRKRPPSGKLETKITDFTQEEMIHYPSQVISINENHTKTLNNLNVSQGILNNPNSLNLGGLGLGSMGLGGGLKVELGDHEVFASLDPAEHDFGNVLNNLPADAFNDIFIESRNGEYEPSREEEEELERALEAVDKDVRNLERMGQTHGLLEPALLAQLMSDIAS